MRACDILFRCANPMQNEAHAVQRWSDTILARSSKQKKRDTQVILNLPCPSPRMLHPIGDGGWVNKVLWVLGQRC